MGDARPMVDPHDSFSYEDWANDMGAREVNPRSLAAIYQTRCDCCGHFVQEGAPGVSWAQQWSYDYEGTPDLHDTTFRCSPCTDKHGMKGTNCDETRGKYHGRNPIAAPAPGEPAEAVPSNELTSDPGAKS
jgi:hypothetical protein